MERIPCIVSGLPGGFRFFGGGGDRVQLGGGEHSVEDHYLHVYKRDNIWGGGVVNFFWAPPPKKKTRPPGSPVCNVPYTQIPQYHVFCNVPYTQILHYHVFCNVPYTQIPQYHVFCNSVFQGMNFLSQSNLVFIDLHF